MTSAWLTRACVLAAIIGVLVTTVKTSSSDVNFRRLSAVSRRLARLCDAILMGDDDVIVDRKRKWGDNTMMTWGKRSVLDTIYALSLCQSLWRNLHLGLSDNSMSTWKGGPSKNVDADEPGWHELDLQEFIDKRSSNQAAEDTEKDRETKRNWSDNTMATWGKRR